VWTFDRLNQYINNNLAASKDIEVDWVFRTLTVGFTSRCTYTQHDTTDRKSQITVN